MALFYLIILRIMNTGNNRYRPNFGRIREFITDEMLTTYEVISVRNDYPTGSFMILKTKKKTNWLFQKSKDYKKIFTQISITVLMSVILYISI